VISLQGVLHHDKTDIYLIIDTINELLSFLVNKNKRWDSSISYIHILFMYTQCLYGPFCHGALKLDMSTLFTAPFRWTSLQFIFCIRHSICIMYHWKNDCMQFYQTQIAMFCFSCNVLTQNVAPSLQNSVGSRQTITTVSLQTTNI